MLVAHSAAEGGFKFLIGRSGASYPSTHDWLTLLNSLRTCYPDAVKLLDDAFAEVAGFYGSDTSEPDYRHLAFLSAYREKVGAPGASGSYAISIWNRRFTTRPCVISPEPTDLVTLVDESPTPFAWPGAGTTSAWRFRSICTG